MKCTDNASWIPIRSYTYEGFAEPLRKLVSEGGGLFTGITSSEDPLPDVEGKSEALHLYNWPSGHASLIACVREGGDETAIRNRLDDVNGAIWKYMRNHA